MSRKDYVPVGEILTRKNGKKYEAVKHKPAISDCDKCAFGIKEYDWCRPVKCVPSLREDGTNVFFVRRKDLEIKD